MIDMDTLLEQFPSGRGFAFTPVQEVGQERFIHKPEKKHADHLVEATVAEVAELVDALIIWQEERRVTTYPVIHAAVVALSGSAISLSEKHLRFLASIPAKDVLRRLEVNHTPTEDVAVQAHLTYLGLVYRGRVSAAVPWPSLVPLWTTRLMFEAWEEVQAGRVPVMQSPWIAELLLRSALVLRESEESPLPLEVRARLTPTNWVYEGRWCAEFADTSRTSAPFLPHRAEQIRQRYPDLLGLPGGLVVEMLANQEVTDPAWHEPVPERWQAAVEELRQSDEDSAG